MSWKEKIKEWGGGDMTFLSEDGEVLSFVVVGDPVLLKGQYKGKESDKVGCPVVTEDGYQLFIAGKRLARKISKYEDQFGIQAFTAIRHGEAENPLTTYELRVVTDTGLVTRLFALKESAFKEDMIAESVEAAEKVMKG